MFDIMKKLIEVEDYDLAEMIDRLMQCYFLGKISQKELGDLMAIARENADPMHGADPLADRVGALERAQRDMAARLAALEGGQPEAPAAEPYEPTRVYYPGDLCTWEGKVWEWVYYVQGSWSPSDYPAAWREVGDAPAGETPAATETGGA